MSSKLEIKTGRDDLLIVVFGGMAKSFSGIPPFEFLNFLSQNFPEVSQQFYIDHFQSHYHQGIKDVTTNIEETVVYLREEIKGYKKVIFGGTSAGGYASILFGSLLNVDVVLAFIPQTQIDSAEYGDLKSVINEKTQYYLYGDPNIKNKSNLHSIFHCYHLKEFSNVTILELRGLDLKGMRDNGELKKIFQQAIDL